MFTGIVEETGAIRTIRISGSSGKIAVTADKVLEGTKIGDSIAVNGGFSGKGWIYRGCDGRNSEKDQSW